MVLVSNIKKTFALICLSVICACAMAQAQYTDKVLCDAYMAENMKVWDAYLHSVSFSKLSLTEQKRYLNYEYGYVATAINEKAPDAKQHLKDLEAHINALETKLPKSTVLTYRSGMLAYHALMNKLQFLTKGMESFNMIKDAYKADPNDPMMLCLKGNVDFYAPKAFGGSKDRAMEYFYKAIKLYEQQQKTVDNWNYMSARMCAIQCEDQKGNVKKALGMAEQLLKEYPNYKMLRDKYLPDLRTRAAKSKK